MKKILLCIISAALSMTLLLCGCSYEKTERDRLSIVTTCFPPYDFARAVAGDSADIKMLLSAGAEAHSYEPAPMDIAAIQNCDIFICIGNEDEVWVDRILDSIDTSRIAVIRLMNSVEPLYEEEVAGASPSGHDHDHDHDDEGEYDGHIWTSPKNALLCVEETTSALCSAAPENAELYRKNSDEYSRRLIGLDEKFRSMTEHAPHKEIVIADRFPFRYLSHEYGIGYSAAFSGCSSESEPSVYTMAYLMNEISEHNMDVVFCLEFSTKKLAEKLCSATGAHMLTLHSCHNVSKDDFENGVTYIDLMEENLANLREALY